MWQHMFFGANMIWNVLKFRALHYFITRGILLLLVNFRIWNLDREKRDYTQTKTFDLTKPGLCGQDMHFIRKNRKKWDISECHISSQRGCHRDTGLSHGVTTIEMHVHGTCTQVLRTLNNKNRALTAKICIFCLKNMFMLH